MITVFAVSPFLCIGESVLRMGSVPAALRPDLERFWMTRREHLFDEHCR